MAASDGVRLGVSEFAGSDGFHEKAIAGAREVGLRLTQRAPAITQELNVSAPGNHIG
jgi:hypothetical protein